MNEFVIPVALSVDEYWVSDGIEKANNERRKKYRQKTIGKARSEFFMFKPGGCVQCDKYVSNVEDAYDYEGMLAKNFYCKKCYFEMVDNYVD